MAVEFGCRILAAVLVELSWLRLHAVSQAVHEGVLTGPFLLKISRYFERVDGVDHSLRHGEFRSSPHVEDLSGLDDPHSLSRIRGPSFLRLDFDHLCLLSPGSCEEIAPASLVDAAELPESASLMTAPALLVALLGNSR